MTPSHDKVLLEIVGSKEEKTESGLFIPEEASDYTHVDKCIVIATGVGIKNQEGVIIPVDFKEGDKVLIQKRNGLPLTLNGKSCKIVREGEILCTVASFDGIK